MTSVPPPLQQIDRTYVRYKNRTLSYFAGCDYFRLASHPKVLQAVHKGLDQYGLNVSASRLTTGNHEVYDQLEKRLAAFFDVESAVLASNGYAPNLMVAQALSGKFSHVLLDERAHGCLIDAGKLLDCTVLTFKHRSPADLERILKRLGKIKPLVMTDGMFSHDGSIAPLKEYLKLMPSGGLLHVDDAHGAGTLGKRGRGTPELLGVSREKIIQTITLSKAFGVFGGAVLGPRSIRDAIVTRSRSFVGSTPLPLPLANAALVSLELLNEDRKLRERLALNISYFKTKVADAGFPITNTPSPVIAIVPEGARQAATLVQRLLKANIHPPFIKYPGGPVGGYFRFVISSEHSRKQLDSLLQVLARYSER